MGSLFSCGIGQIFSLCGGWLGGVGVWSGGRRVVVQSRARCARARVNAPSPPCCPPLPPPCPPGNFLCNFAACYSCHAREKLRRRYNLPPAFGLPPGVDDCLVHFFCFYCASHQ